MLLFNFSVEENVCERDGTCFAGKSANIVKTLKYLAITDITQKQKTKNLIKDTNRCFANINSCNIILLNYSKKP